MKFSVTSSRKFFLKWSLALFLVGGMGVVVGGPVLAQSVGMPTFSAHAHKFVPLFENLAEKVVDLVVSPISTGNLVDNDHNSHTSGTTKHSEHSAIFDFVPYTAATHFALANGGNWSNPSTWNTGTVPGDGARVIIPENVSVTYDTVSDARLYTVRVDGTLKFATNKSSKMVVDTLVGGVKSTFQIGTKNQPLPKNISVDIVIANNGDIDVTKDVELLSRGVILHGATYMYGHEKTTFGKVAVDPKKGDTSVTMAKTPTDWEVGDRIVIAGTRKVYFKRVGGKKVFQPFEDEVRTITGISGKVVSFASPLVYNHTTPRPDLKTYVGNYTRNITLASEGGSATPIHHRGHFMQMHSDDVDIRYAAFDHLGRTDKSKSDKQMKTGPRTIAELSPLSPSSNIKGRYSMHFHRTGFKALDKPALAIGNAVTGAPGWGYVHHDANAIFHNNVSYDTIGAAYVAETGNETGSWTNNLAIGADGAFFDINTHHPKESIDHHNFDLGSSGEGFFFQGRMVHAFGNVAASVNTGYNFMHRGRIDKNAQDGLDGRIANQLAHFQYPEVLTSSTVQSQPIPILGFNNNEVFGAIHGLYVTKNGSEQSHDIRTQMKGFKAWNVKQGAGFQYTAHYTLEDFDIVAEDQLGSFYRDQDYFGIGFLNSTNEMSVLNSNIEGFAFGIKLGKDSVIVPEQEAIDAMKQFVVVNPTFKNVKHHYGAYDPALDVIAQTSDLVPGRMEINLIPNIKFQNWRAPIRGSKVDSIGLVPVPSGFEMNTRQKSGYDIGGQGMSFWVNDNGYYDDNNGRYWTIYELYLSDRITGEPYKIGVPIEFEPGFVQYFGTPNSPYKTAPYRGKINFNSKSPVVSNKSVQVGVNGSITVDLLSGASDPDGDTVVFDRAGHADHGLVYPKGNGQIKYVPHFDYRGQDKIKYWVTDGHGKFSSAWLYIGVGQAPQASSQLPSVPVVNSIPDMNSLPVGASISLARQVNKVLSQPGGGSVVGGRKRGQTGVITDAVMVGPRHWYKINFNNSSIEGWVDSFYVLEHWYPHRFAAHIKAVSPAPAPITPPSSIPVVPIDDLDPVIDDDGDGINDDIDNCVGISNANQADADDDGVGDVCDATPFPPDGDGDGVPDDADNCVNQANPNQADTDSDGVGDVCDTTNTPPASTPTPVPGPSPAPPAGTSNTIGTGNFTFQDIPQDRMIYDIDKVNGGNVAQVPLSGTAPAGAVVQGLDVGTNTWHTVATADSSGAWSGVLKSTNVDKTLWRKARVRLANNPSQVLIGAKTFSPGTVFAMLSQSEFQHMIEQHANQQYLAKHADLKVYDNNALQVLYVEDDTAPTANLIYHNVKDGDNLTVSMAMLANFLTANAPGHKFMFVDLMHSGSSRRELMDDGKTARRWTHLEDTVNWVRSRGSEVGLVASAWWAADATAGKNHNNWFAPLYMGQQWNGAVFNLGDKNSFGETVDHILWDITTPDSAKRGRGLFARARTKYLEIGPNRFIPKTKNLRNALIATDGKTDWQHRNIGFIRDQLDKFLTDPRVKTFALPQGPQVVYHAIGEKVGTNILKDSSHPNAESLDGLPLVARHMAVGVLGALGYLNYQVPEFSVGVWADDGSYIDIYVDSPNGGAFTTPRLLRNEASLSKSDKPYYTEIMGFEIDQGSGFTPSGFSAVWHDQAKGIVRLTPATKFKQGDMVVFGRGGTPLMYTRIVDEFAGTWKNYPVEDIGVPGYYGLPLKPLSANYTLQASSPRVSTVDPAVLPSPAPAPSPAPKPSTAPRSAPTPKSGTLKSTQTSEKIKLSREIKHTRTGIDVEFTSDYSQVIEKLQSWNLGQNRQSGPLNFSKFDTEDGIRLSIRVKSQKQADKLHERIPESQIDRR